MKRGCLDPLTLQIKYEMEKRCGFSVFASRETVQGLRGEKVGSLRVEARPICGLPVCVFLRYGLKLEPWRQASFDAPYLELCAPCARVYGARVMAQGGSMRSRGKRSSGSRSGIWTSMQKEFYVGRAADGRAVRVSVRRQPAGGAGALSEM